MVRRCRKRLTSRPASGLATQPMHVLAIPAPLMVSPPFEARPTATRLAMILWVALIG